MAQMPRELELLDPMAASSLNELKTLLNTNNRRLQEAYRKIHNDINWKEWLYFSVSGKRWRIGPDPDTNNWVIQELTGANWRNQSHWTTMDTAWGGPAG